jgi:hypothetical protein
MARKTQAFVGVLFAAIAIVALMAAPAFADVAVTLGIGPVSARYGTEILVIPTVVGTETIPGDAITLEALNPDGITWEPFGEGLKVEDTATIDPQYLMVDSSLLPWYFAKQWHPVQFRAIFKPISRGKDSSGTALPAPPAVTSNTAGLQVVRNARPKVSIYTPAKAKRGYYFNMGAQVSPNSGEGPVRFRFTKKGSKKTLMSFVAESDDSGYAEVARKITKRGTYKVEVTFLGNAFAPASKTYSKYFVVR